MTHFTELFHWCMANAHQHTEPHRTCEVNSTSLAEACAHAHGHDEWMDDEIHDVWDAAAEAAEQFEKDHH